MKFGAVPEEKLCSLNLSLPPEPESNSDVLPGARVSSPKVYVGAATWGSPSWSGKLYPVRTPAAQYRSLYIQQFNTIELDATHYNIYPPEVISKWAAPAEGKAFKFCPKFPRMISHESGFKKVEDLTAAFLESVGALGPHLGPIFLQMSESYSPEYKDDLFAYLVALPIEHLFFLEVRHPAWFIGRQKEELSAVLRQANIGMVITDSPGRRDAVHMHLSVPKVLLRFVCNGLHPTSFARTDAWVQQLQRWLDAGLNEAYIFLHPGNDSAIPELVAYWVQALNEHCGLNLKAPTFQPHLF